MWRKYQARIKFIEPLLGVEPKNPAVYEAWLKTKQPVGDEGEPEFVEEKGWTGFFTDENGLYLMDYHIKGYFKEVAVIMPEVLGLRRKTGDLLSEQAIRHRLDNWLFPEPRRIYLGKKEADGYIERPLRARTLRGDRIALARSDYVDKGLEIQFNIVVLESSPIGLKQLRTWLEYGSKKGMGQFRTGGYGRFELLSLIELA